MTSPIALLRAKSAVAWLGKKAAAALPAILLSKLAVALEAVIDARTPAWKRAAAAAVLLELADLLPASIPAAFAVRFIVLRAIFEADARAAPVHVPVDTSR